MFYEIFLQVKKEPLTYYVMPSFELDHEQDQLIVLQAIYKIQQTQKEILNYAIINN